MAKNEETVGADIGTRSLSRVALDVLLTRTLMFLIEAGVPRAVLARELQVHAESIGSHGHVKHKGSEENHILVQVSSVVHDWCREAEYLNERTGGPKELAEFELTPLIARRFPDSSVTEVMVWMEHHGVISREPDGRFVLRSRTVVPGTGGVVTLERVATLAGQYLEIGLHNANETDERMKNVDRSARVLRLPTKHVAQFREFARDQTQAFLERVDNWLEDRNAGEVESGPLVEAGVHAYAYVGRTRMDSESASGTDRETRVE